MRRPTARATPSGCCATRARWWSPRTATPGRSRPSPTTGRAAGCRATPGGTSTRSCGTGFTNWAGGCGSRAGGASSSTSTATPTSTARRRSRAGIAVYGKNTMAITRRHGSWVVLGVLVTDLELAADREAPEPRLGRLRRVPGLHRRLPDRRDRRGRRAGCAALPFLLSQSRLAQLPFPESSRTRFTAATSARTSVPGTAASSAAPGR